jgi:hypothetical protein
MTKSIAGGANASSQRVNGVRGPMQSDAEVRNFRFGRESTLEYAPQIFGSVGKEILKDLLHGRAG